MIYGHIITLGVYSQAATFPTFLPPGVINHVVSALVLELQLTSELERMIHTSLYWKRSHYTGIIASQGCTEYFAKNIYFHYIKSFYCLICHKYVNLYYFSTDNLCNRYFSTTCVNFIATNWVQLELCYKIRSNLGKSCTGAKNVTFVFLRYFVLNLLQRGPFLLCKTKHGNNYCTYRKVEWGYGVHYGR